MRSGLVPFCLCALVAPALSAQSSANTAPPAEQKAIVKRFEVGTQYAFLGKGVCYRTNCNVPPEVAVGTTFTWNVTPNIAMDVSSNFLTTEQPKPWVFSDGSFAGGRGSSTAGGPRLEVRRQHYGLFLYGQMGAEVWSRAPGIYIVGANGLPENPPPAPSLRSFLSVGAGFGAEYSPTPQWHFRISTGQRVINYGRRYDASLCRTCYQAGTAWNTGDDFSAGAYLGFGPSLRRHSYRLEEHPHRFFDKTNDLLIAGAVLASVGDGITTQLFLDRGIPEGNSIERTFVQRGLGGDIGLGAIAGSAGIGAMYGLHRMGHHWIERFLPAAVLVLGARNTYLNAKLD